MNLKDISVNFQLNENDAKLQSGACYYCSIPNVIFILIIKVFAINMPISLQDNRCSINKPVIRIQ